MMKKKLAASTLAASLLFASFGAFSASAAATDPCLCINPKGGDFVEKNFNTQLEVVLDTKGLSGVNGFRAEVTFDDTLFTITKNDVTLDPTFAATVALSDVTVVGNKVVIKAISTGGGLGDGTVPVNLVSLKFTPKSGVKGTAQVVVVKSDLKDGGTQVTTSANKLYDMINDAKTTLNIVDSDFNGDGIYTMGDVNNVAVLFGTDTDEKTAKYDVNKDGKIDIIDLSHVFYLVK